MTTYIFISHRNVDGLGQFPYRVTQVILEMTLLALMSPLLVCFTLECRVMQLEQ